MTVQRGGFTMVEVLVAMVLLGIALLGAQAVLMDRLLSDVHRIDTRTAANQIVRNQIEIVRADPRYESLRDLYNGTDSDLAAYPGFLRITEVQPAQGYTTVTVHAVTSSAADTVSRTIVISAP